MAKTRIDELRGIRLFSGLSNADLQAVASNLDEVSVPSGTALISEGKGNHAFYLLLEGEVDVKVGGEHRRTLGAGAFFGEISMLGLDPATASVVAKTPVRLCVASHEQFMALKANDMVLLRLKAAMGEHLHADRAPKTKTGSA
jgi:CRP-like cAMP-binding protein